ncbi:hypothetical protein GCK32_014137, partial [Trichostrongylus colubriformis]
MEPTPPPYPPMIEEQQPSKPMTTEDDVHTACEPVREVRTPAGLQSEECRTATLPEPDELCTTGVESILQPYKARNRTAFQGVEYYIEELGAWNVQGEGIELDEQRRRKMVTTTSEETTETIRKRTTETTLTEEDCKTGIEPTPQQVESCKTGVEPTPQPAESTKTG